MPANERSTEADSTPSAEGVSDFRRFVEVADAIGATTKRLEKSAALAKYLASIPDDDLPIAVRFISGRIFPLHDQRTINIGGAAVLGALEAVSGRDGTHLRERLVALGDLGDVAGEVITARSTDTPLTLRQVNAAFEELAATSGAKKKLALATALLERATASEARYVVKLMLEDLRIGLKEGGVEETLARMHDENVGRVQWVGMLTGDLGETALLARRHELGAAHMRLFHPLRFMLATPAKDGDDVRKQMPGRYFVEDKYDGIRAQAHVAPDPGDATLHGVTSDGARVALFSRTLDAITGAFPELAPALAAVARGRSLILDGEIVPVQGEKILPFQVLQRRLGRKRLTDAMLAEMPVAYVVFDILYDGELLLETPLEERRRRLDGLDVDGTTIRRSDAVLATDTDALPVAFAAARERGNEGLMLKSPDSLYKPGRRGRDWLKVKQPLATLDVVVTAVEVGNGRRRHLLSDFTFAVRASESDPTLLNVGKAYSGLTDAELEELTAWFNEHTLQQFAHGKVRIVAPEIVIEVAFDRVQPSARHKSGYALRFPRIVRLRPDKPASEIDTLATVKGLAEADGDPIPPPPTSA
jgi:DNA ligase 1